GHLHAFNNIGTIEKPVIYASSPLCYSFSEAGQTKYVALVNLEPNEQATITRINLTKGTPLVRKTFQTVENAVNWLLEHPNTLVELTIASETSLAIDKRTSLFQDH